MKLSQRLAQDRETLRRLEGKARGRFIWDYYIIPILVLAAAIVLGAIALGSGVRHGKTALYAVFVNAAPAEDGMHDAAALEALLERGGVNMKGRHVDLTADLYLGGEYDAGDDGRTIQVLAALFGISDLDFFAADPATFDRYASQDAFADLSRLIEPELLDALPEEDRITYANSDGVTVTGGVVLHPGSPLHDAAYFFGDVAVGAAANGENLDAAVALLRELLRSK